MDKETKKTNKIIDRKLSNSEKQVLLIYRNSLKNIRNQLLELNERSKWNLTELRKYDRLQKLQLQILDEVKQLSANVYNEIRKANKDIFLTTYNRKSYEMTKKVRTFLEFDKLDTERVKAVVEMPYPNVPLKDFIKKIGNDTYEKMKIILGTNMATGNSLEEASKEIKELLNVSYSKARTIARTEGLRASSQANLEVTQQAEDMGLNVRKRWLATLDERTRDSHRHLDNQLSDDKGYFYTNGVVLEAPRIPVKGDPKKIASEVINCRCTYTEEVEGISEKISKRMDNITKKLIDNMSYDEWYEKYRVKS